VRGDHYANVQRKNLEQCAQALGASYRVAASVGARQVAAASAWTCASTSNVAGKIEVSYV
jgi:hypothetical protein